MNTCRELIAAAVSAIFMAGAVAASHSGVAGTVTVSPSCPGPQRLDEECASALGGVLVKLVDRSGTTVGVAKTSAKGEFEIVAPPGTYQVEVAIEGRLPRCPPTSVTVEGGKKSAVRISCDSGMR
jgi:hypothetical protein